MGELRALSKSDIFLNQGRQKSESSEIPAEELPPSSEELSETFRPVRSAVSGYHTICGCN